MMQLLSLGHSLRELQDPASQECLYSRSAALEKGTHTAWASPILNSTRVKKSQANTICYLLCLHKVGTEQRVP